MEKLKARLSEAMEVAGTQAADFGSASGDQRNALWPAFWNAAQAAYKARLAVKNLATEQALGG